MAIPTTPPIIPSVVIFPESGTSVATVTYPSKHGPLGKRKNLWK
jgi:hypothetical protein